MKKFFIAAVVVFVSGCGSVTVPMSPDLGRSMEGRSLEVTWREKHGAFSATTPGKALFGGFGGAAMIVAGNKIVRENNVDDPAFIVAEKISKILSERKTLLLKEDKLNAQDKTPKELMVSGRDLILDVYTTYWGFSYLSSGWDKYRVLYSVKIHLLDSKNGKTLAEGFCSRVPKKVDNPPSYDELLEAGAKRLKEELNSSANSCADEFLTTVFGL